MEISTEKLADIDKQSAATSALELYKQHAPKYLRQRLQHKMYGTSCCYLRAVSSSNLPISCQM